MFWMHTLLKEMRWFKYNTLGCCSGFHGNLGCETKVIREMPPL